MCSYDCCLVLSKAERSRVAVRYNRMVCEAALAVIVESGVLKSFWAEAVNTAVKVILGVGVLLGH